jgi:hypothetical protein
MSIEFGALARFGSIGPSSLVPQCLENNDPAKCLIAKRLIIGSF